MAQQPAVVIIARHGPRLDAADQLWHLSTPTPYDPPLTYGGWNQCKALGVRIATLLQVREAAANDSIREPAKNNGVLTHDFALLDGDGKRKHGDAEQGARKRRKRHKVVIHTSPFLRCVQTSVAIAAGMAQFQPPSEPGSRPVTSKSRTPSSMHSASPRLRGQEGIGSPTLAPIAEPREDLAHAIARRALGEHKRYRKSKLRVDAFLGEWLNPQYFEQITPPPPSAMMVATAKAELMQNEAVDIFTPTVSSKASNNSLWGAAQAKAPSREGSMDEWSDIQDSLPGPATRRDRAGSVSSLDSNDSSSGRRSPFKPGRSLPHFASTIPKPENSVYVAPTPHYAVSASDVIPRGYVAHARSACVNVDYQWDSSRPPQNWGDGGEYGEEWSAMHKRFRRGLNHMIQWYSQHNADDRAEDSLGFDQAEKHEQEEEEDLVVVLVTHGAGSNALIGALTGQPVLLDVGMASLTMAVRRDDAPPIMTYASSTAPNEAVSPVDENGPSIPGHARRGSLDLGLSSVYEMKLVSSSEHLRPGADPGRTQLVNAVTNSRSGLSAVPTASSRSRLSDGNSAAWSLNNDASKMAKTNSTSTALGSIRRPSAANPPPPEPGMGLIRSNTSPVFPQNPSIDGSSGTTTPLSPGLWTPPAGQTSNLQPKKVKEDRKEIFSSLNDPSGGRVSPGRDLVLDFSTSPPDSRPTSSSGPKPEATTRADSATTAPAKSIPISQPTTTTPPTPAVPAPRSMAAALNGALSSSSEQQAEAYQSAKQRQGHEHQGSLSDITAIDADSQPPGALGRTLSQKGLWGSKPRGDQVDRKWGEPKRRWTVNQEDGVVGGGH